MFEYGTLNLLISVIFFQHNLLYVYGGIHFEYDA